MGTGAASMDQSFLDTLSPSKLRAVFLFVWLWFHGGYECICVGMSVRESACVRVCVTALWSFRESIPWGGISSLLGRELCCQAIFETVAQAARQPVFKQLFLLTPG